jgi:hypothetical protein
MANSSGSSPASLRRICKAERRWSCVLAWLFAVLPAVAEMPAHLRTALANFNPGVPAGWACTITTTRNDATLVERFNPSAAAGPQWTLLQYEGRPPTAKEQEKYRQSRPPDSPVGPQATFTKADIEPGSLRLLREDAEMAEYQGAFRKESTGADKMLGHLILRLTVAKRQPHVAAYSLSLADPYSPVLAVKMNELEVKATFAPPGTTSPSLPAAYTSRFKGRMLFFPTEETLRVVYSDFAQIP